MVTAKRKNFGLMIALLVLAVLINYMDRGNLALAAPLLRVEWGLSASQLGLLLSAFFWTYMLLQIPAGWLVDRVDAGMALAVGFVVWTGATAMTGLAGGFGALLAMRLLLGCGEAIMFPATSKIYSECIEEKDRGLANGLVIAAIHWGTAIGTFGGGLLIARFGWRVTFLAVGLVALAWVPPWLCFKPAPRPRQSNDRREALSFARIARLRQFWGISAGHFCSNYLLYFLMSWLPYYLVQERHLSMASMTGIATMVYSLNSASAIAAGWIADRKIRRGVPVCGARKWCMIAGFLIAIVALLGCAAAGPHTYLLWLAVMAVGGGTAGSGVFAVAQTLAGPELAGRWVGMQNCVANLSGVVGPTFIGILVERTGHFRAAFAASAVLALAGAVALGYGLRSSDEPVCLGDEALAPAL